MNNYHNLLPEQAYNHVDEYFPGLFTYSDGKLYFSDLGISKEPLLHQKSLFVGQDIITISLSGKDLLLTLLPEPVILGNRIEMNYDFELSMEACMSLYKYDIHICYINEYDLLTNENWYKDYDRLEIERQWTIKNIIN